MSNYTKDNSSNQYTALYEKRKKVISITIILSVLSGILMSLGLQYSVFILIACGIATSLLFILSLIVLFTGFSDEDIESEQLIVFTLYFSFIVVFICWFFNWHYSRYITPDGSKQHLYRECPTLSNSKEVVEVSALEGFFHLCFKDCKTCLAISENIKEQNKQKRKEKRERENWAKREKHRIEMLDYFKKAINNLENCTDPAIIDDYYDDFSTIGMDVDEAIMEMTDPSNR